MWWLFEFIGSDVFFVEFVGGFGAFERSNPGEGEDGRDAVAVASAGRGGTRGGRGGGRA